MTPVSTPGDTHTVGEGHLDEERLVDLALSEPASGSEVEHLGGCAVCRDGLTALRRTVDVTRESSAVQLDSPSAEVWARIDAELDAESLGVGESGSVVALPVGPLRPASPPPDRSEPGDQRLPGRRRRPALAWLAAACVAGALLGAGGVVLADRLQGSSETRVDVIRTVATAELDTLDTQQTLGSATVSERAGALNLAVSATELDRGDSGYVEVWLLNRDGKRMVSVGVLRDGAVAGAFPVTRRLLDEGYVVVDLSREQFDDKPQHSGDSIVRGSLRTTA